MIRSIGFGSLLLASLLPLVAGTALAQSPNGNPLDGLERLKTFESRRSSSSDEDWRNGNHDSRRIEPGETLTLGDLDGPGMISHLWCTISHRTTYYPRLLTLRIYWDGESRPSVECPIGDFFGVGNGVDQPLMSLPIRDSSGGKARNCYWPMPFRKSAKITVTNDSDVPCRSFYYYVDWQKHPSIADDAAYFHAMYRQEYPCKKGENYLLADIVGRGHYIGTVQSVCLTSPGWYGEGDDFFFIDGAKEPQLRGTGTEDYFCNAWGFQVFDGPYYGVSLFEGFKTGCSSSAYRFHVPDPVAFARSLRVEIEHKGSRNLPDGELLRFVERDDLMSSVAFWYQTEPHKPWPALPKGCDRLPFHEEMVLKGWTAVDSAKHSDGPVATQAVAGEHGVVDNKQLLFHAKDDKAWMELEFEVDKPQTLDLSCKFMRAPDYGVYRILLDGQEVAKCDLGGQRVASQDFALGRQKLDAGKHTIRFQCAGKSRAAKGYKLGFASLTKKTLAYEPDSNKNSGKP
ncbi:MAG: glycoside hydrolase family 172 protein [Thermoguttaceae bacterium]